MKLGNADIQWLGHASFLIRFAEKTIYIDPFQIGRTRPDADYIFVTHSHYDHLSIEDIDNVVTDKTVIVAPEDCRAKLHNVRGDLRIVSTGRTLELADLSVEVVASYNINKKFHPHENGWVGYILEIEGKRIYHSGDTDLIPEMKKIRADLALVPVSGTYVMTAAEAAKAVVQMKVKAAIPMHYGSIVGDENDAKEFKKLAKGVKVVILDKS